jgi:precorrin-6B methylase 2
MTRVIDIGCAEGYYAVGFAKSCPDIDVIAFDIDHNARQLAAHLAKKNQVGERVVVEGECTPDRLEKALQGHRALVICDIEGAESAILDPQLVPALRTARLLVEIHDHITPDTGTKLKQRFSSTHSIETIAAIPRTREHCPRFHPLLALVPQDTVVSLIVERPDESRMYWLLFEPIESNEEFAQ